MSDAQSLSLPRATEGTKLRFRKPRRPDLMTTVAFALAAVDALTAALYLAEGSTLHGVFDAFRAAAWYAVGHARRDNKPGHEMRWACAILAALIVQFAVGA